MSPRKLSRMIQKLRETNEMSQRDLARAAKVTQEYIAQLEMGLKRNPAPVVLQRVAKALGVPLTELVE